MSQKILDRLPILSHSEAESYELCERRHYYAFGERIKRNTISDSLLRGILGHEALAAYFQALGEHHSTVAAEQALNSCLAKMLFDPTKRDMALELQRLLTAFVDFYRDLFSSWSVLAVEKEFRLEFPDFIYAFTTDLIYHEGGYNKVLDYKFTYDFYDGAMLGLLPQLPRYIGGLRALGHNIRTGDYCFIRYRSLKSNSPNDLFAIVPPELNTHRFKVAFDDLRKTALKIQEKKKLDLPEWKESVTRVANNLVCKSCSFKELCVAEANGSNGLTIRQTKYTHNDYGYLEEPGT